VSRRRRRGPDEPTPRRGGFADALGDVRPLAGPEKQVRPPPAGSAPTSAPARAPRRFVVEGAGAELCGRAEDVSRAQLAELRRGGFPPELEVDLHGLGAGEAQPRLERTLARAQQDGLRCALVIHGRGAHSRDGAVLREALPEWLQAQADRVLAFAAAPPGLGGAGATLVLLRRTRVSSAAPARRGRRDSG